MTTRASRAGATDGGGPRRCAQCSAALASDNTTRLCGRCLREHRDQLDTPPKHLSDDFWTTDDFKAASESQHIGRVLKAYRNHPRHLQLFGKALNQEVLGRWLGLTQAQVSKLENGKPEENLGTLRAYAEILSIPQYVLWFDLPGQTRINARSAVRAVSIPAPSLLIPQEASLSNTIGTISPIDTNIIDDGGPILRVSRLTDARTHFERMYRNSGGLVAGARIETYLARQTLPLMAARGGSDEDDMKLKRAIGSLIALAGVCAYDSEDWNSANSHFAHAIGIAQVSKDYGFHAYVLALMVNQTLALEDYKVAEHLAGVALRSSAQAPPTPLTIDLKVMRAKALAAMGDAPAALSIINELEAAVGKLPANGIVEASYAQESHLQAQLAEAFISLGDLRAAQRYAEQSLLSEGHARGKVNRLASMATLEVAKGDIEHASSLVCEMVDSAQGMGSRRLNRRFKVLRAMLASRPAQVSKEAIDRIDGAIVLLS